MHFPVLKNVLENVFSNFFSDETNDLKILSSNRENIFSSYFCTLSYLKSTKVLRQK